MIGVPKGELIEHAGHIYLFIIGSEAGCVTRHEEIGNDAAPAVDDAAETGLVLLTGSPDAVGVVVFSASSAREQVSFVVFFVAGREGLLNAAAGGRGNSAQR